MSGRVLMSSTGIRVSKPGKEVQSASINDLLLDISMVQGQILAHGYMPVTAANGSAYGPWSGSVSIGPFSAVPDVLLSIIFAGNKQCNPPIERVNSGIGFRYWSFSNVQLSQTSLSLSINGQGVAADGIKPQGVLGVSYLIFRRTQI